MHCSALHLLRVHALEELSTDPIVLHHSRVNSHAYVVHRDLEASLISVEPIDVY